MKKTCLTMSVLLVACTSMTVGNPKQTVAQSATAIKGAEQSGAENVPPAADHLALAVKQRDEARTDLARGDYFDAYYLARRAQVDAELAQALANEARIDQRQGESVGSPQTISGH